MANKNVYFQVSGGEVDLDAIFETEPGEYFELEQALGSEIPPQNEKTSGTVGPRAGRNPQTLMSTIEDGVVNIGPDGRLLYFNSGFAAHFLTREQLQGATTDQISLESDPSASRQ